MNDLFESQAQTECWLITKDAKGKVRCIDIHYTKEGDGYIIHRTSFQYKGKRTIQPAITITQGKVKRDTQAQTILRFMSLIKSYKDKGYKEIERDPDTYSEDELYKVVGNVATDQFGVIKPMLCKKEQDVKKRKIFDKKWLASRKINGVRCLMYWKGNKILTASRGGTNYNLSTIHLTQHPTLIKIFKEYPTLILDLELYKFGKSLQQCSGAARLEKNVYDCNWLEMYVYDCYFTDNVDMIARDRIAFLNNLANQYNFSFNPERTWNNNELQLQMVPHLEISGWDNMKKLHNQYISNGWEGLVIRDPDKPYKPNSRGERMIKIKQYIDETFKVIGYELGLRGSEDMVLICQLLDGRTFKASPIGTREIKQEYMENFEIKYKNHLGDCKYFELSDEGIPCQPKFICWRFDLE